MPFLDLLETVIPYCGVALLGVVAWLLARRKLYAEFPIFGIYVVSQFVGGLACLWMSHLSNSIYFYAYWIDSACDAVLSIAAIVEIFKKVLRPYEAIRKLGAYFLTLGGVILLAAGAWMAIVAPGSDVPWTRITTQLIVLDRSASFVRFGILFLLFIFCRFFGLTWRHYLFGFALGLAFSAAAESLSNSIRIQSGWHGVRMFALSSPLTFDVGVVIWGIYLVSVEARVQVAEAAQSPSLAHWNDALEALLAR